MRFLEKKISRIFQSTFLDNIYYIFLSFVFIFSKLAYGDIKSTYTLDKPTGGILEYNILDRNDMRELISKSGPTAYDFSNIELINLQNSVSCLYRIAKFGSNYAYVSNVGIVNVSFDGILSFKENFWSTRGISNAKYLQNEANLRVDKIGRIIGKIPIFHKNIKKGQSSEPPVYDLEFDGKFYKLGVINYSKLRENESNFLWKKIKLDLKLTDYIGHKMQPFEGEHIAKRRGGDFHFQIRYCAPDSVN